MWVPDTVVYGETGRAIWVYSDPATGCVQRSSEFSDKQVLEKFTALTASDDGTSSAERVIVFKEPIVTTAKTSGRNGDGGGGALGAALLSQGSQLRLLNLAELKTLLSSLSSTTRKSFAIQRFVKCSGAKAFVLRSVYESGKSAYAWMVSNTVPIQEPAPIAASSPESQPLELTASTAKAEAATPGRRATITAIRPAAGGTTTPRAIRPMNGVDVSGSAAASTLEPTAAAPTAVPLVNRLCTSVQIDRACTFVKLNERACATTSELTLRVRG